MYCNRCSEAKVVSNNFKMTIKVDRKIKAVVDYSPSLVIKQSKTRSEQERRTCRCLETSELQSISKAWLSPTHHKNNQSPSQLRENLQLTYYNYSIIIINYFARRGRGKPIYEIKSKTGLYTK